MSVLQELCGNVGGKVDFLAVLEAAGECHALVIDVRHMRPVNANAANARGRSWRVPILIVGGHRFPFLFPEDETVKRVSGHGSCIGVAHSASDGEGDTDVEA